MLCEMFIRRYDLCYIVIFQRNTFLIVVSSCYSVIFSLKDLIESSFFIIFTSEFKHGC